ncbi:MAG: hypothetical protein HY927_10150 [Elusimicrobia bacterium]|nr:hypothetical protein [Elusimicrobiota bacterium]
MGLLQGKGGVVAGVAAVTVVFGIAATTDFGGRISGIFLGKPAGDLSKEFKAAKERGSDEKPLQRLPGGARPSSLAMVLGDPRPEAAPDYVAKVKGGDSVKQVLTPEESRRASAVVQVSPEDLAAGGSAPSGGLPSGGIRSVGADDGAKTKTALKPNAGPYAGKSFFDGNVSTSRGFSIQDDLKNANVPPAGASVIAGRGVGSLSKMQYDSVRLKQKKALEKAHSGGDRSAYAQLVNGRASILTGAPPDCSAANGCSAETASTKGSAAYDGTRDGGGGGGGGGSGSASGDSVDGGRPASMGDAGGANSSGGGGGGYDAAQMAKLQEDKKKCDAADAQYKPTEDQLMSNMMWSGQSRGDMECRDWMTCEPSWPQSTNDCYKWAYNYQCHHAYCHDGHCHDWSCHYHPTVWSNYYYWVCECRWKHCYFVSNCNSYNDTRCAHQAACPFTAGNACEKMECK